MFSLVLVLTLSLFLGLSQISLTTEQPSLPKVELPLIVTTCGQSPGALMVWVLSKQIKLPCDRNDLLTAEHLKAKAEEGNPYKTLIITTGTSMKGMGAAGVDIDYEVARIEAIIEEAKKEGILIIGAHIEGMARRVDATDAASIATVIPESKLLLIREDSNEDGYFTKAAEEQGIPIIIFKETLDIIDIFKQLFNLEG
ncbi:hypothetical protein ES695_13415 [Candidatus Atribacteria bacterium 1244-E10-H5-B2]|nr:MAG: hypothetical protein ES695_13415 [Candidatus Atribacteria bacterium 1244-E10-H5-B2]